MFFGMALAMTALEYIAGLMSLKVMHLRLWDCLLYTSDAADEL